MKRVKKPVFFIVAAIIIFLTYSAFFGIHTQNGEITKTIIKGAQDIRWGIDIRGGIDVTFRAEEGYKPTKEELHRAKDVINNRLVKQNVVDFELYVDEKNDQIIVWYPWPANEKEFNPEKAIEELGARAFLTFREGNGYNSDGTPKNISDFPESTIIVSGSEVIKAEPGVISTGTGSTQYVVKLQFSDDGFKKFSEATKKLAKKDYISIWLDDTLVSSPYVNEYIEKNEAVIEGNFSAAEARKLADTINAGTIPFKLVTEGSSVISPTFGKSALDIMVLAGIIAFSIVCLFMVSFYRLPGFVACIALLGQVAGSIACISGYFPFIPSYTLTIPGIAGIILSIGMGVDANIITNERLKEELRLGKTLDSAIDAASENSFSAIFDGNITMIIVSIILMGVFGPTDSIFAKLLKPFLFMFGASVTGAVSSFGFTLLVGVFFNFLMGVTASRLMLKSISRFKFMRNKGLYGVSDKKEPVTKSNIKFDFMKNRKIFLGISAAVILIGLTFNFINGTKLDIKFKGGSMLSYTYEGKEMDQDEVEKAIEELLGKDVSVQLSRFNATVETEPTTSSEAVSSETSGQDESSAASETSTPAQNNTENPTNGGKTLNKIVITLAENEALSLEQQNAILNLLAEKYPNQNVKVLTNSVVPPFLGREFLFKCLVALALAAVTLILYVGYRFRNIGGLSAGTMAILALIHDIAIAYFTFIILGMPIDDNFVAVALAILGFSVNDTIIIYDRIRENKKIMGPKASIADITNLSINQTLGRTINTSLCTIMAMATICLVSAINNLTSIYSFAFPMMAGLISGSFTTVCLVGPIWVLWVTRKGKAAKKN